MIPLWFLILHMVSNHLWLGTHKFININLPTINLLNRKVHMDGPDACYRSSVLIISGELLAFPLVTNMSGELLCSTAGAI